MSHTNVELCLCTYGPSNHKSGACNIIHDVWSLDSAARGTVSRADKITMLQETKAQGNEQDQNGRAEKLYTR